MMFHVTSVLNRESITVHGLDISRMGAARGIAGSTSPEADGIFVCDEGMVDFFVRMNNTGGPVDVWQVDDVDSAALLDNGNGFFYLPGSISRQRLSLHWRDLAGGDFRRR